MPQKNLEDSTSQDAFFYWIVTTINCKHLLKSKIIMLLLCDYLLYVIEIRNMEAIRAFRL
ncbi:hypothetical protein CGH33_18800 [Vibrio parahaemolyticus]|nr:hypothetical protein CGH44_08310 [Vibrio parahaemolyticus]TOO57641.1 hypothetical protein CGH33_18800 [Vibrio parahaemolyticus]